MAQPINNIKKGVDDMSSNNINEEYSLLFPLLTRQQKRMIISLLKTIIPKGKQEALQNNNKKGDVKNVHPN